MGGSKSLRACNAHVASASTLSLRSAPARQRMFAASSLRAWRRTASQAGRCRRPFAGISDFELFAAEVASRIDAFGADGFQVGDALHRGPLLVYQGVALTWRVKSWEDVTHDACVCLLRVRSSLPHTALTRCPLTRCAGWRRCCCSESALSCWSWARGPSRGGCARSSYRHVHGIRSLCLSHTHIASDAVKQHCPCPARGCETAG
jgi:hypothetical protein